MASNIKGITIEIDGNTTGLSEALKGVNKNISSVSSELRQVNSLLKLDPTNTELTAQKQKLLSDAINDTSSKLATLKKAKADADQQFAQGKISEEQYRALDREIVKTELSLKDLNKSLDDNKKKANSIDFSKLSQGLADVGKKAGEVAVEVGKMALKIGTAVATAMGAVLTYGVKYNSEIEQLTTSFEVMTGSAEKATEITKKLKDAGSKTPYDLKGLATTTQTLMQYGLSADEAYNATMNFGDIAQGSAEKMQSIALAYGQMSSAGKVNMQDIKQMINAGFNPLQAIADKTGKSMKQVTAEYEAGRISVQDITDAMAFASSEGGKYYQSMEKQSKTLAGQVSTLKDNFASLSGTLAGGVTESIKGGVLPAINELLGTLETAFTEGGITGFATALGDGIANLITRITEEAPKFIGIAVLIIQNLVTGIQNNLPTIVQSAFTIIMSLINAIIGMLPQLAQMGITLLVELIKGITQELPQFIKTWYDMIFSIVDLILENLDAIIIAGIDMVLALALGLIDALPMLISKIPYIIVKVVEALTNPEMLKKLIYASLTLIIELAKGLIKAIPELVKAIPQLINAIVTGWTNQMSVIFDIGKNVVKGIWEGISGSIDWIKDKIKGWVGNVTNFIKKLFGINSPSRLMRDQVGMNIGLGVAEGIEGSLGAVQNAMGSITKEVEASVNPIINPTANSNPLILQIENFNNTRTTDVQALMEEAEFYRRNTAIAKGGN